MTIGIKKAENALDYLCLGKNNTLWHFVASATGKGVSIV